jgi:hypothetical protein
MDVFALWTSYAVLSCSSNHSTAGHTHCGGSDPLQKQTRACHILPQKPGLLVMSLSLAG